MSIKKLHDKVDDTRFFWMLIGSGKKKKLELGRSECCPDEKQSKIVYKFQHKHGKTRTHKSEPSFPSATNIQLRF